MWHEIVLDGERTVRVRTLGIYEIDDHVSVPDIRPFTYELKTVTGKEFDVELDPFAYSEPPKKPETPEDLIVEKSPEWYALLEWQRYQGALAHSRKMSQTMWDYLEAVHNYVIRTAIHPEDSSNIQEEDDLESIYHIALIQPVTHEHLADALRTTFGAQYDEEDILEALKKIPGGKGSYNGIRVWEVQVMIQSGMNEVEFGALPVKERARRIAAFKIDDWLSGIELHRMRSDAAKNK